MIMALGGPSLLAVIALVYMSCSVFPPAAGVMEEMGFFGLMNSCKFRRSINRNVCCSDLDCPSASCCELYLMYGGVSAQGICLPRDPNTLLCSRRKSCRAHRDCGHGECCRLAWKREGQGVCDRLGQHGNVCTRKPVYMSGLPLVCPCDTGHTCDARSYLVQGMCIAPDTRPPTLGTTTIVTRPPTAPPAPPTTTLNPCALCPTTNKFCCLNNQCRIRPGLGQECGVSTCKCRDNTVCSDLIYGTCQ